MQNPTERDQGVGLRAGAATSRLHRLSGWMLAVVVLAAGLAVAELSLRAAGIAEPTVTSQYRVPHPVLGWALEPGATYLNPLPEESVRVTYNSGGWRDVEHETIKPPGTFRILVLGDSFMEAYSVGLEDAFHRRLEASLLATGRKVEAINLGVAGYGTLQEYLVFREAGLTYSPDLVLLGFCLGNDLRNNSRELEARLGDDKIKLLSRPFLADPSGTWEITAIDVEAARRRYETALKKRGQVLGRLYQRSSLLQLARSGAARLLRGSVGGPGPEEFELAVHGVHYCRETLEYRRSWTVTARILARLRDEVRAAGAALAVFTAPTQRESSRPHMESIRRLSPDPGRLCLDEAPGNQRLGSLLDELGISFIDLLPEFRRIGGSEQLFRNSDRHWNGRGHALAVELVGAELERLDLLP